jgi:D-tagatose-1,6-bisphosphate aldolase subunit GatZ/KbaZ
MSISYLKALIASQKQGQAKGITSICSAQPWVLKAAMHKYSSNLLIETTCNQVNQFGGYTGMTPIDFVAYIHKIADENNFPFENIILGGDHLGPNVWQNEPEDSAMQKSSIMIKDYITAGFTKIHLDCSMPLMQDDKLNFDPEISARRAAKLAKVAEETFAFSLSTKSCNNTPPCYVIGTEVPVPGGASEFETIVPVSKVEDVEKTIELTKEAFIREGIISAWDRVIAVVVQPGVEFGDDFVLDYQPALANNLTTYIEGQSLIYEAHSTDFQTISALQNMVRDHFAILKVGPGLTFAFREAIFGLALIENELFQKSKRSNLIEVLNEVMLDKPIYWQKYYRGMENEITLKRKFSLSDRIRYYWNSPKVQFAINKLLENLNEKALPYSLLSQFTPYQYERIRQKEIEQTPESIIIDQIQTVLINYEIACGF